MESAKNDTIKEMMVKSAEAKSQAYCPYSNFRVGAALLTENGNIIQGCNVENASYTLGICAERCAIFKAVSEGNKDITAIAVSTDLKDEFATPCGACRQVIFEFARDADIYLVKPDMTFTKTTIKQLLPSGFNGDFLNMDKIPTMNGN